MSNKRGKQLNKYVPSYVLFDLETTGISANYDEVIEISAVNSAHLLIRDERFRMARARSITSMMRWWQMHRSLKKCYRCSLHLSEMIFWLDIILRRLI